MTCGRRALTAALSLLLLLGGAPAARSAERPVATLRPDGVAFWDSEKKLSELAAPCAARCQDFALVVRGTGERLRVAADGDGTRPAVLVFDRTGRQLVRQSGIYSAEAYVSDPEPGRYVVRVEYNGPAGEQFRLRAKLEREVSVPRGSGPLLPNLRLVPPYQFTMEAPAAGQDLGCNPYEQAEYGARRCLRFSLGPANVGTGPLMLEFPAMSGIAAPEPVFQLLKHADGRVTRRQAGTALWHKTHAHHHHQGFGSLELLKVTDLRRGTLRRAGVGPKQGFCMLDFQIADWRSFRNERAGAVRQDCSLVSGPTSTQIGLGAGWADIYTYGLDGNYVEFGTNGDGRYVVRSVADAGNDVLESNERDNTGYAYVEVRGSRIEVLERGQGAGPWDPRKRLADDLLPPNA